MKRKLAKLVRSWCAGIDLRGDSDYRNGASPLCVPTNVATRYRASGALEDW